MNVKNIPFDISITVAVLLAAVAIPAFHPSGYLLTMLSMVGMFAIALKGFSFVTGTGEISVGHAALFGVGAYTAGWVHLHLGLPLPLAFPVAIAASAFTAWLISFPLLRVNGPFMVLTTIAFGRIVYVFLSQASAVTGGQGGMQLAPQSLFSHALTPVNFFYLILGCLAVTTSVVYKVAQSKTGRAFEALKDSPIATDCMGIGTASHKQKAFVFSGAAGGLAGVLYVYSQGTLFPDTFGFETSLMFLMAALLGGKKSAFGPLLGAAFIVMFPDVLSSRFAFEIFSSATFAVITGLSVMAFMKKGVKSLISKVIPLLFGAGLLFMSFGVEDLNENRLTIFGLIILMVVSYLDDGVMGLLPTYTPKSKKVASDGSTGITRVTEKTTEPLLKVTDVTMTFGGFKALCKVTFSVDAGSVMGLIGPNGAGKSTTMNVLTALYQPTTGTVNFNGICLSKASTTTIAKLGISRTFQNLQVFGDLSVLDNVLAGMHNTISKASPARAMALLTTVGLADKAHVLAKNLSYGQQRFLEIARALATNPKLLLLDEPAAGLRGDDLKALKDLIATIKAHGLAVILIEHHMDVVMGLSDHITVLDFGQVLARGTPHEIQTNQAVQEAYLGA